MGSPEPRSERQARIKAMMAQLCAPDLTLGEAKALRDHLAEILERTNETKAARPRERRSA